jgi:hypothetical protein
VSADNDNNAIMAQLLMLGTNFVNFMGRYAFVGEGNRGFEAIAVTERDEPQAVLGSYLQRIAYPEQYSQHIRKNLTEAYGHSAADIRSLQVRGEYLYTANGPDGLQVFDIAQIDQKGFSERIVTAPVSPAGQRLQVPTRYATAVAAPTTLAVDPVRSQRPENDEQAISPIYGYIYVTDKYEGLILVGAATLLDGNPANNFLKRAATYNPGGLLNGANSITLAGNYAYVTCDGGLVILNLADPLKPAIASVIGSPSLRLPRAVAVQFRYAFVTDADGLKVIDITSPEHARVIATGVVPIDDARDIYVARTYAYIAAGRHGLFIVDVEHPESPKLFLTYDAGGAINDANAVRLAMTNASLFAYIADGRNGLRVLQMTSPERTPGSFGYSPEPSPELIATYKTRGPAIALSKALDRDRAVDESGNQIAVFGRRGARPFNESEMKRLYLKDGKLFSVTDAPPSAPAPNLLAWIRAAVERVLHF